MAADLTLEQVVRKVQQSDRRFWRVHPEVRGRVVYLSGSVGRWEDLVELARSLAGLPGVERVVLKQVRTGG